MSIEKKSALFNKVRKYAFLLLKFRLRSSKEIAQRLKKKKFHHQTIKEVVSYLEEKGFIDDEEFARDWLEARIKRGFGFKRIRIELSQKGIDKQITDTLIQETKHRYSEGDSLTRLAEERWLKLSGITPQKAKQRLFGYLARRGFPAHLIIETLNNLTKK